MNDNFDDFLNSLDLEGGSSDNQVAGALPSDNQTESVTLPLEQPQTQNLSNEDFDDILEDFGFSRTQEAEAEEIVEESADTQVFTAEDFRSAGEEAVANVESRLREQVAGNLDEEEDNDWEERLHSGELQEVPYFQVPYRNVVDVPILQENNEEANPVAPNNSALLPENSPTLLIDDTTSRFSGAEWYNEIQTKNIIVGGCGGISSNLAFQLARMHPASIFIYDDDSVEQVNMAGQLFCRDDVGLLKVTAMEKMIEKYTTAQNIYAIPERFTSNTEGGPIMMCGFDNMEARKIFYYSWKRYVENNDNLRKYCFFLDGRLDISNLQVFCITGDDKEYMQRYEQEYLFDDSEAEHTICSLKQTTYMACMIGSVMTNLFTNWVANSLDPIIPYDLPFFTEYDAQNMIFKTIK